MPISYKHKIYIPAPDIQNANMRADHPVKSQISVNYNGTNVAFDVLDYDRHDLVDTDTVKTMCVCSHDIIKYGTIPFYASQLMYYTEGGLPAGNYKFTLDHAAYGGGTQYDGTYMFTLTQDIPADGGFRHTNIGGYQASYAQSDVIGNYITTYGVRPKRAEVEKSVAVKVWDGTTVCTDLGTFTARSLTYHTEADTANGGKRNFTERNARGSNRWRDCVYRQWLNSDAEAVPSSDTTTVSNWWKPATVFDRVPGGAKLAGFLNGLDPEFVAVLGEIEVKTALCDCDKVDGATYDITHDKVWLQSMTEIFGSNNNGIAEGNQLAYWVGASDADRIKYEGSTARYWWLRSPNPVSTLNVRSVNTSGVLGGGDASNAYGVVPTFCIKQYDGGMKPVVSYKRKLYMGRNIEWNQLFTNSVTSSNGVTILNNQDGTMTLNGTVNKSYINFATLSDAMNQAHKYFLCLKILNNLDNVSLYYGWLNRNGMRTGIISNGESCAICNQTEALTQGGKSTGLTGFAAGTVFNNVKIAVMVMDLTQMFGAGNEPATPEEFWFYFDHKLYPYNTGETQPLFKISRKSQWGSVTVASLYVGEDIIIPQIVRN